MAIRHLNKIIGLSAVFMLAMSVSTEALAQASQQGPATTVGSMLAVTASSWSGFPTMFSMVAYILGLMFAAHGVYLFKEHIDKPGGQTPLSAGVKKFLAGGMLFSTPFMAGALQTSFLGGGTGGVGYTNIHGDPGVGGLDEMAIRFIADVSTPASYLLMFFSYLAGIVLLITGIVRLTKTAQEGARGPTGLGTLATFVSAGALFSLGQMIAVFSGSLFGTATVNTYASISQDVLPSSDADIVAPVIEALMIFIMIVGFIAFIRGWFVLKAFADGSQQATLAQALTFLVGGTLAINLGDLVNALETTVGVSGITFQ